MTSSNHSSTDSDPLSGSTGADDRFVDSVFDPAAAAAGGTGPASAVPPQGADGTGPDDVERDPVEDLDSVADELAAAARAYAPVQLEPGSAASVPTRSPDELTAELAKRVGLDLDAGRTTAELPPAAGGPIPTAGPGSGQAPGPGSGPGSGPGHDVPISALGDAPDPPALPTPPLPPPAVVNQTPAAATEAAAVEPPRQSAAPIEPEWHPVDQVAVRKLGGFNFLSVGQWTTLPRDEKARLIKGNLVQFLYEGDPVGVRPALLWFKRLSQADEAGPDDPPTRPARR